MGELNSIEELFGVVARIGSESATLGESPEMLPVQCQTSTTLRAATTSPR